MSGPTVECRHRPHRASHPKLLHKPPTRDVLQDNEWGWGGLSGSEARIKCSEQEGVGQQWAAVGGGSTKAICVKRAGTSCCPRDDYGKAGAFSVERLKMGLPFASVVCAQTSVPESEVPARCLRSSHPYLYAIARTANRELAGRQWADRQHTQALSLAVGETVILLHSPLPSAGVSIGMKRGCQRQRLAVPQARFRSCRLPYAASARPADQQGPRSAPS